jgi:hypothetical protein
MDDKKQPCDGESNGSKVSGIHSVAFDIIGKFLLRKNNIAFYPFLIDCIECYLCSTNPAAEGNPDDDEATFFSTLSVISQVESLILEALTNGTCGSLPSKYEKNLLNLRFFSCKIAH